MGKWHNGNTGKGIRRKYETKIKNKNKKGTHRQTINKNNANEKRKKRDSNNNKMAPKRDATYH